MGLIVARRPLLRRDQIVVGVGGAILLHLWAFLFVQLNVSDRQLTPAENPYREFSIELSAPEEEEPEQVFTQTNPDAPENEPDETNRFAARDQQAANPDRPEELDPAERPATESDDIIETDQFLSGSFEAPQLAPPPSSSQPADQQSEPALESQTRPLLEFVDPSQEALQRQIPIAGTMDDSEPEEEGIAEFDRDPAEEAPTNISELIEGQAEEGESESESESPEQLASLGGQPSSLTSADGVPSPRPRPRLPRVSRGPVRNSDLGVSSIGQLGVDAKASKFGEYMERLIETTQINWDDLANKSSHTERNSVVRIRFTLTKEGLVSDMEILEGTTARAIGIYMCRTAIERGVPFGPWPAGLTSVFGDEEDITFSFHYY